MTERLLGGDDAPLARGVGVAWCGVAGYLMGTAVLASLLPIERFHPNGPVGLLAVGLAPGLLSATAAWLGARASSAVTTALLTLVGSLVASLFCPPFTWVLLAITGGDTQTDSFLGGGDALGVLVLVTILGAFLAAPLGVLFGMVFSAANAIVCALHERTARGTRDLALVALGLGMCAVSAVSIAFLFDVSEDPGDPTIPFPAPLVGLAALAGGLGALAALVGAVRAIARHALVLRMRRGRLAGWAVVDAREVAGAADAPRLFAFGDADRVLVRRATTADGPFRSGETAIAVARV